MGVFRGGGWKKDYSCRASASGLSLVINLVILLRLGLRLGLGLGVIDTSG